MTDEELYEEIKNADTFCFCCKSVKEGVLREGLEYLNKYDGIMCGQVEGWKFGRTSKDKKIDVSKLFDEIIGEVYYPEE